ncbi:hypothetical protein G7011_01385 [Pseudomonas plecoglossicida]|uniref:hypothetical protein n=1 Tax=Pseudomonas plecoglossicida TaxID=70775 RepID=UPI0015E3A50B|nr:hypothetical protein [Pseudomonas plecoglossicida]MBA1195764.1 hypothetical protein [Pseudomonas plecoglossicida]
MKSENTTTPSPAQPPAPELRDLRHLFRAAHGAQGIARVLLEDQAEQGRLLETLDREALLSALEFCTQALYAHHEFAYYDALPQASEQGGTQ